jgi:hypothetical protein
MSVASPTRMIRFAQGAGSLGAIKLSPQLSQQMKDGTFEVEIVHTDAAKVETLSTTILTLKPPA